MTTKTSPN